MYACEKGAVDVVLSLLRHDVAVNLQDRQGSTALMKAAAKARFDVVFCLVEERKGASTAAVNPNLQDKVT